MQVVSLSRSFASLDQSSAGGSGKGSRVGGRRKDGNGGSGGGGGDAKSGGEKGDMPMGSEPSSRPTAILQRHEWYLDRLGKLERFRRQLYSLALAPMEEPTPGGGAGKGRREEGEGLVWIGVAVVLEWPKDQFAEPRGPNLPAFARDTSNVYFVTSRDGVFVDHSFIYAHTPLLPKAHKRQMDWDGGFLLPAPHFVMHASPEAGDGVAPARQLSLYFEARAGHLHHEQRFDGEAAIGRASWPAHRIVGLRAADPGCHAHVLTKALNATPRRVHGDAAERADRYQQSLHVEAELPDATARVRVEMRCAHTGKPPPGFDAARSVLAAAPAAATGMRRVVWTDGPSGAERHLASHLCPEALLQLRFELEGTSRLYAFQLRTQLHTARSTVGVLKPAQPTPQVPRNVEGTAHSPTSLRWLSHPFEPASGRPMRDSHCAVVGSGGGLVGSGFGGQIDAADVVIRVNRLPVSNEKSQRVSADVGQRTDIYFVDRCLPKAHGTVQLMYIGRSELSNRTLGCQSRSAAGEPGKCPFKAVVYRGNTRRWQPSCVSEHSRHLHAIASRSHIATGIQSDAISDAVYDLLGFQPPAHNKPTTGFHAALTFAFECRSVRLYGFEGAMTSDGHMLNLADHNVLMEHKLLARLSNRSLHVPIGNRSRVAPADVRVVC